VKRRSPGRRGRPVRSLSVEAIRDLYRQGHSFRSIAAATGIGYGTVRRAFHGQAPRGADMGPKAPVPFRGFLKSRRIQTRTA
jgi:DNA invertase Pin-like site-specific DNA recombinase